MVYTNFQPTSNLQFKIIMGHINFIFQARISNESTYFLPNNTHFFIGLNGKCTTLSQMMTEGDQHEELLGVVYNTFK